MSLENYEEWAKIRYLADQIFSAKKIRIKQGEFYYDEETKKAVAIKWLISMVSEDVNSKILEDFERIAEKELNLKVEYIEVYPESDEEITVEIYINDKPSRRDLKPISGKIKKVMEDMRHVQESR